MSRIESRLAERYPQWFEGPKALLAKGLIRSLARFGKLDAINAWLAGNGHRSGFDFVEGVLDHLGTRYTVDQVERGRIPQTGPVIIVATRFRRCARLATMTPATCTTTSTSHAFASTSWISSKVSPPNPL